MKKRMKVMALLMAAAMTMTACSSSKPAETKAAAQTAAAKTETKAEAKAETAAAQTEAAPAIDFPTKAIDIVVPFAAGGNVDMCNRILAAEMEKQVGQPVNVLNKEGGGAVIGQTYALGQKPDGYTILALTSSYVTNVLSGATTFDMDSVIPIGQFCFDPEIIVVSGESDIETLEQFIEKGKAEPLLNSTPGFSTSHHIASLIFTRDFGVQFEYMHTNGSAEQTVQLAGGHAEVGFTTYGGAASLIEQGKIRVLATCANERHQALPDVPTVKELIGEDFVYGAYRGWGVPAGTPDEIVKYLSDTLGNVAASQDVIDQFNNSGFPIQFSDYQEFKALLDKDYVDMTEIQPLLVEQ